MVISDTQLKEFQELYKQKFGIEISREDAYEKGMKLIRFFLHTHTPLTRRTRERGDRQDNAH